MGEVKMIPSQIFLFFFFFFFFRFLTILTGKTFEVIDSSLLVCSQSSFCFIFVISWNVFTEIQIFHNNSSASAIFIFPKEEF